MTARESRIRRVRRGVSPVVGVAALLALTVCLAAVLAIGIGAWSLESGGPGPAATFELSVDGEESTITIEHIAGDSIDVEALSVTVAVDGEELTDQPPVPFVGASGFDGAPDGPFNAATDPEWRAGERVGVAVADTNDPEIEPGDSIRVTLVVDGHRVAALESTAK
ncbi:type IV pilin [Natronorubrum sp. DTA28]|uniref:type IV pilin n=1 Tax=Natronorubrum sp. DTA28 TaxID=3447019 RepID=UPI003F8487DD